MGDLRERLSCRWAYAAHWFACLPCRVLPHDWCEWDTLEHGPGGRTLVYRVCNRCCELEEHG